MANPSKFKAIVSKIISHGEGVYTVDFSLKNGIARFKPGQFLHLTLDEFDPSTGFWPESRVFSISSMPGDKYVEILYSVRGKYTQRMSEELCLGREVWLKFPYGDFIIDNHLSEAGKIVLIAGGTGISPFIPFLKNYAKEESHLPLELYYGIRNDKFFLYREFLDSLKDKIFLEVTSGNMDLSRISVKAADKKAAKCFVSGPPVMIKAFREKLIAAGLSENSVIIDAWE